MDKDVDTKKNEVDQAEALYYQALRDGVVRWHPMH